MFTNRISRTITLRLMLIILIIFMIINLTINLTRLMVYNDFATKRYTEEKPKNILNYI